jgi:hypothetical protein
VILFVTKDTKKSFLSQRPPRLTIRTTGTSFPTLTFGTAGTASVRCNDLHGAQRLNDLNGLNLTFGL